MEVDTPAHEPCHGDRYSICIPSRPSLLVRAMRVVKQLLLDDQPRISHEAPLLAAGSGSIYQI